MTVQLQEAAGTLTPDAAGKKFRARLIEGNIWGSSGYYPQEVLERDGPTTWPAGTQVYLDHPTATEGYDRPERSVRDLAGKIASTPAYESDGLYAEVEFYPHFAPVIEAMWQDVGMSIRASASIENGEAAGRKGPIIQSLENGMSVDVVTRAGAGGKLVNLLESAREGAEAAVVEATASDIDTWLERAVQAAYAVKGGGRGGYVYVRDHDDQFVYYRAYVEADDTRILYREGYTLGDGDVTLSGDRVEVNAETVYKPVAPATTAPATESTDSPSNPAGVTENRKESAMTTTTIEESELSGLRESASRVTALEADNATLRKSVAEAVIAEAFAGIEAPRTTKRILEAFTAEGSTMTTDALRTEATESAAEIKVLQGAGKVDGVGDTTPVGESKTITDDDIVNAL